MYCPTSVHADWRGTRRTGRGACARCGEARGAPSVARPHVASGRAGSPPKRCRRAAARRSRGVAAPRPLPLLDSPPRQPPWSPPTVCVPYLSNPKTRPRNFCSAPSWPTSPTFGEVFLLTTVTYGFHAWPSAGAATRACRALSVSLYHGLGDLGAGAHVLARRAPSRRTSRHRRAPSLLSHPHPARRSASFELSRHSYHPQASSSLDGAARPPRPVSAARPRLGRFEDFVDSSMTSRRTRYLVL